MLPLDKIFSGKTPPSSGGLNQVVFGTFIKSFMLPIRRALPWKLPGKDESGSMLSKISVRGDGSPRDMVFHASKPSTGMGFCGSNVPPNYKTKQNDNNDFSTKQANNTGGPSVYSCNPRRKCLSFPRFAVNGYYLGREDRLDNAEQEPITLTAFLKTERFLNRFRFARLVYTVPWGISELG